MKVTQASIKVVLLFSTCCLLPHVTHVSAMELRRERSRYCGRNLADMLAFVCDGQYNFNFKRSELDADELSQKWLTRENMKFLSKHPALSVLFKRAPFLKKSQGIVEECCMKPCSFNVLYSYCLPKTTRRPSDFLSTTQRYERSPQQGSDY